MNNGSSEGRIPNGYYQARAIRTELEDGSKPFVQLGLSKRSGTKQVLMMFQIEGGEHKGKTFPWFGYITEDSRERTIAALRLCGWKGKSFSTINDEELTDLVSVTIETETYDGKTRSRVSWVNDLSGPKIELDRKMDAKAIKELDKLL